MAFNVPAKDTSAGPGSENGDETKVGQSVWLVGP